MSNGPQVIEQFPLSSGWLVKVPAGPQPDFVTYRFAVTERTIPVLVPIFGKPNMGWFPVVAVKVDDVPLAKPASNNNPITVNSGLARVSFWLTRMDPNGDVVPPGIDFQVRVSSGCTPEVVGNGTIKGPNGFSATGMLAQVSGYLCNQVELWARIAPGGNPVAIGIDIIAERFYGAPREFFKGSVAI